MTKPIVRPSPDSALSPGAPALEAALVSHASDGILAIGPDGRILSANGAAAAIFGRPADRLRGARFQDLVAPAEREGVAACARMALMGTPQKWEAAVRTGAGGDRRVAGTVAPLWADAGKESLAGTVMTVRDVTDERLANEELARSESRYRHLFEGANDAIMTFDALGRFTTINHAGEVISGYSRDELIGRFFGPLLALEALPKAVLEFRRALSGSPGQFETTLVRKDGQRRSITVNYSCPQRSREVLCLIRDATEEKQLQQQLIQSEKMAAIGQLVSGVAHELNNPLASISAFAQLLMIEGVLSAEQRHSVDVIGAESRRAARIVNNLLTFARQHRAEKVYASINKILDDTLELREYELKVRGIRLTRDFDDTAPATMVDVYQLQQVLLNLVTNAEQAMMDVERPHHHLIVRSRAEGDVVRIVVEDSGPGIPADALEVIFNPFYTTKPTGSGTGLGLSISLGIVTEHGGRIWAENVPGGGSRFCVELPLTEMMDVGAPDLPPAIVAPRPGLRVLVADDEQPLRVALERFLRAQGHSVVTASCGNEVLGHAAAGDEFDVLILDIRMPDVSGKQIFERWRREGTALAERVVFLTGDTVSTDLQAFLSGTGRPYLSKPFDFDAILRVLPQRSAS